MSRLSPRYISGGGMLFKVPPASAWEEGKEQRFSGDYPLTPTTERISFWISIPSVDATSAFASTFCASNRIALQRVPCLVHSPVIVSLSLMASTSCVSSAHPDVVQGQEELTAVGTRLFCSPVAESMRVESFVQE